MPIVTTSSKSTFADSIEPGSLLRTQDTTASSRKSSPPAVILEAAMSGKSDPKLVQATWLQLSSLDSILTTMGEIPTSIQSSLYNPGKKIEYGAMGKHHITNAAVKDAPPADSFKLPDGTQYLISHNIDAEWHAIGLPNVKRIDTFAIAKKLWPEIDSHQLPALLYFLDAGLASKFSTQLSESEVRLSSVWHVFNFIVDELRDRRALTDGLDETAPWFEELWAISEIARSSFRLTFGKMENTPIHEIGPDYKKWLLSQPDLHPGLRKDLVRGYGEEWPWPVDGKGPSQVVVEIQKSQVNGIVNSTSVPISSSGSGGIAPSNVSNAPVPNEKSSVNAAISKPLVGAGDWSKATSVSRNASPLVIPAPKSSTSVSTSEAPGSATAISANGRDTFANKSPQDQVQQASKRSSLADKLAHRARPIATSTIQQSVQRPRG